MAEAIVINLFLLLLIGLQIKENKNIVIVAEISWFRRGLAIALALAIVIIFWQTDLSNQIKLMTFAGLVLFLGFNKEGLACDHLVKFGLLTGKYREYSCIQIEELRKGKSLVSFYRKKNNRFSMQFLMPASRLIDYFERLDLGYKIILGDLTEENSVCK